MCTFMTRHIPRPPCLEEGPRALCDCGALVVASTHLGCRYIHKKSVEHVNRRNRRFHGRRCNRLGRVESRTMSRLFHSFFFVVMFCCRCRCRSRRGHRQLDIDFVLLSASPPKSVWSPSTRLVVVVDFEVVVGNVNFVFVITVFFDVVVAVGVDVVIV